MSLEYCVDWQAALQEAQGLDVSQRLSFLIAAAGGTFHPADPRLVTSAGVKLWAIGGLPFTALAQAGLPPSAAAALSTASMGLAGSMSYLSLPGGTGSGAFDKIAVGMGHTSCAHVVTVSLAVGGVSCACENEFNSQRDVAHLARVTEARTAAQSAPPLVLRHPELLEESQAALRLADELAGRAKDKLKAAGETLANAREAAHLLFPAAKASAFIITASLRNFQKLLGAIDDEGKEAEYREVLRVIRARLASLWPELFTPKAQPATATATATATAPTPTQSAAGGAGGGGGH
jgi:hypothetical protein